MSGGGEIRAAMTTRSLVILDECLLRAYQDLRTTGKIYLGSAGGLSPTISRKNDERCRFHQSLECCEFHGESTSRPSKNWKKQFTLEKMLGDSSKVMGKNGNFTLKSHHDLVKLAEVQEKFHPDAIEAHARSCLDRVEEIWGWRVWMETP